MIPRQSASGPVIKTVSAPKITYHPAGDEPPIGAAVTIDWSKGSNQQVTLDALSKPLVVTSVGLPPDDTTAALTLQVAQNAAGDGSIVFVGGNYANGFALSAVANAIDLLDVFYTGHNLMVSVRGKHYA